MKLPAAEAVGVPELLLRTAKLADVLACPPMRKSTVELFGNRAPLPWFQKEERPEVAIVIDPFPFVMEIPEPAVRVALVRVLPLVLPIRSCPSVYVVCPVPPFTTLRVPVERTPDALV